MKVYRLSILLFLGTWLFLSCGRDDCNHIAHVSFSTNINRAEHLGVYSSGGWAYASGGACGLIVHNTGRGLIAYDRCSTVELSQQNRVVVEGMVIVDPTSGAKWLLIDGSPAEIARCHLRTYPVHQAGDTYYVRN